MLDIMDGTTVKINYNPHMLSTEMIASQPNDWLVPALEKEFEAIIREVKVIGYTDSNKYFKDKTIKNHYKRIDQLVLKRTGLPVVHGASETPYGIFTAPPKDVYHILKTNAITAYNNTVKMLKQNGSSGKKLEEVIDFEQDIKTVVEATVKSMSELSKKLNADGVLIDLEKATISGLPKDYKVAVATNIGTLVHKLNLNAREITALLLHEVGHAFTHIEYSYRKLHVDSVLLDTLHENLLVKNKSKKATLKLIYEDVLDGNPKDIENDNLVIAAVKTLNKYTASTAFHNDSAYSLTDSEALADQFATRFGLGDEIVIVLDKWTKVLGGYPDYEMFKLGLFVMETLTTLYVTITFAAITLITIGSPVAAGIMGAIIFGAFKYLDGKGKVFAYKVSTYDEDYVRYKRIRNDIVRQLRTNSFDKAVTKEMLSSLDTIDTILKEVPKWNYDKSFSEKIYEIFNPYVINYGTYKQIEQLMENLSENNLHALSLKIKMKDA